MSDSVQRLEDMSRLGNLTVHIDNDGDMCVSVYDEDNQSISDVEFCTGLGGGRSPRTRDALRKLFDAMMEDNNDPHCDGRKGRDFG